MTKSKVWVLTIGGNTPPIEGLQVVWLAQHAVVVQCELLPGAQLAAARLAREARQVVNLRARPPHPVRARDAPAALGALGAETSGRKRALVKNTTY